MPPPVIEATGTSTIGLVSVGSSRGAVSEARDILAKRGIAVDYMRIKSFPFTKEVESFMAEHEKIFVVEQNAAMALAIAHRGYVLRTGEIVMSGSAPELLRSQGIRQAYLGEL